MNTIYLLLGSNMGESEHMLSVAKNMIEIQVGKIVNTSSIYRTAAWGNTEQPDFLNQIFIVATPYSPSSILTIILSIEKELGRTRTVKNAARVIDIDILFYNKEIIETEKLNVPHPEIQNRKFVLVPLAELSPDFEHPILKQTITHLLSICSDKLNVQKN